MPTSAPPWLDELNDAQRHAVAHTGGPLLVVAGAGTGKTKTLASRVAYLVDGGVPAERVLLLTFSRRAAHEMLSRAERLSSTPLRGRAWGGTFHAVANRLLRTYGGVLGLQPSFTVADAADTCDLMTMVRSESGVDTAGRRFPNGAALAAIYSRTVNARRPLHQVLDDDFPWCSDDVDQIAAVFSAYTERKRAHDLVDFDDLLLLWWAVATSEPLASTLTGLFDHVLVDEYQDTNRLQADIVAAMRPGGSGVTAVGDDAQAIYSFRAATPHTMDDFPSRFPGTSVVTLEQNYRSTPPILGASNAVMAAATRGFAKELWSRRTGRRRPELVTCADESAQSTAVCEAALAHFETGTRLRDQAVLFRAGHHSDLLEVELRRRNIPFVKYGGLRFLEAAHVKDLLALLRVLDNPYDEPAWFRVLQLAEGVGPGTARRLLVALGVRPRVQHPAPAADRLAALVPTVPAAGRHDLAGLAEALAACGAEPQPEPATQVDRLVEFLGPVVRRKYDRAEVRLADLDQLGHLASGYRAREQLVAELVLDPPAVTGDLAGPPALDDDYLVLSTVHSAKGGEWDVVHVIHAADGMFPSDMATRNVEGVEEERRLLYVALTRARDMLHVYFPLRYHHRRFGLDDAHNQAQLSRFLSADVRQHFDQRATPDQPADGPRGAEGAQAAPSTAVSSVDALLASLWKG